MEVKSLEEALRNNEYPGRGIVAGRSTGGKLAVVAYWIMGRSANSQNRVFVAEGAGLRTQAADPALMVNPSLVIYWPVRVVGGRTIVTNGDHTDTIATALKAEGSFAAAMSTREAEPDSPHYTPRIAALLDTRDGGYSLSLSIVKTDRANPAHPCRYIFDYASPAPGVARYIHTYTGDGDVLESFVGEPELVSLESSAGDDIDIFTHRLWSSLNEERKISLFTRFIDIETGSYDTRIINKYKVVDSISSGA